VTTRRGAAVAVAGDDARAAGGESVEDDALPEADNEDLEADLAPAPPGVEHCRECTILIGPGYVESEPFQHPDGRGYVCWRCFESLQRRAERRAQAERRGQVPPVESPFRRVPRS
jgi:hypothetical protein